MVLLITAALLIFGYVVAQDPVCNLTHNVTAKIRHFANNPEYPNYYNPGRSCRHIAVCPVAYNCMANCSIELPLSHDDLQKSPLCGGDHMLVSISGDRALADAERYCGVTTFNVTSTGTTLALSLVTTKEPSSRGRYLCNLTAQIAPGCPCGEHYFGEKKIVGGEPAKPHEFPMMVGILKTATNKINCGGVIISDQYVMTAAHCVDNFEPAALVVIVGTDFIDEGRTGKTYLISQFIIHDQFDINTLDYDIALIMTQQQIEFNNEVTPVCLPFKYSDPDLSGDDVILLGWGSTSFGGPTSNPLQKVGVSIISQSECRRTASDVTDRKFCTLTSGKDACQKDSGGPVLLEDPSTGLLMSVGIISSGNGCAMQSPGLNTNVVVLLEWVVEKAKANFCRIY